VQTLSSQSPQKSSDKTDPQAKCEHKTRGKIRRNKHQSIENKYEKGGCYESAGIYHFTFTFHFNIDETNRFSPGFPSTIPVRRRPAMLGPANIASHTISDCLSENPEIIHYLPEILEIHEYPKLNRNPPQEIVYARMK